MARSVRTTAIVFEPDHIRIPGALLDITSFRRWLHSPEFPECGRIDWIGGGLEVDMSPEEINTHGTPKAAIARELGKLVEEEDRGVVLLDRARLTCPEADLSVEPDVVVVLFESIDRGRVKLVRSGEAARERCVEIQGAPDLVVECVSNSSVAKDRLRLRDRYAAAGIPEYWIVDARPVIPVLTLLRRGIRGYREVRHDLNGYARSGLLAAPIRLDRLPPRSGLVRYTLCLRNR